MSLVGATIIDTAITPRRRGTITEVRTDPPGVTVDITLEPGRYQVIVR
jgi:hypothetical protein